MAKHAKRESDLNEEELNDSMEGADKGASSEDQGLGFGKKAIARRCRYTM